MWQQTWRFCFQCGKLEELERFDCDRRNCRISLQQRREGASKGKSRNTGALSPGLQRQQQQLSSQSSAADAALLLQQQLQQQKDLAMMLEQKSFLQQAAMMLQQNSLLQQAQTGVDMAGLLCSASFDSTPASSSYTTASASDIDAFDVEAAAAELASAYCSAEQNSCLLCTPSHSHLVHLAQQEEQQQQEELARMLQEELAAAGMAASAWSSAASTPAAVVPCTPAGPAAVAGLSHMSSRSQAAEDACFTQLLDYLLGQFLVPAQPQQQQQLQLPGMAYGMAYGAPQHAPLVAQRAMHQPPAAPAAMDLHQAAAAVPHQQPDVMQRIHVLRQLCSELTSTIQALQGLVQQGLL